MAKNKQSKNNIATEFFENLYSDVSLETKDPQPYYIIHKDTFKTFLYEHKESLNFGDKALTFLGIEISIIVSLLTCDFKNLIIEQEGINIDGKIIQGCFLCSAFVIGFFFLFFGIKWLFNKRKSSIDYICSELEKKSSLLVGKNNLQENSSGLNLVNETGIASTQNNTTEMSR